MHKYNSFRIYYNILGNSLKINPGLPFSFWNPNWMHNLSTYINISLFRKAKSLKHMLKFTFGNEWTAGTEPRDLSQTKLKSMEQVPLISTGFVLGPKYIWLTCLNKPSFWCQAFSWNHEVCENWTHLTCQKNLAGIVCNNMISTKSWRVDFVRQTLWFTHWSIIPRPMVQLQLHS